MDDEETYSEVTYSLVFYIFIMDFKKKKKCGHEFRANKTKNKKK